MQTWNVQSFFTLLIHDVNITVCPVSLTGAGWVLRIHARIHARRSVQRLQVNMLRLWQHLQEGRLAVKRVYPLGSH